jgi:very-short-patch-repair endonuclease
MPISASIKRGSPQRARRLRKNATDAEKVFWNSVRNQQMGTKFRRQWPIAGFVVDFVCLDRKLIVEIDGGQHLDNIRDERRTVVLNELGFRVVRYWNHEVLANIAGVLENLRGLLADPSPGPRLRRGPTSPLKGRGDNRTNVS